MNIKRIGAGVAGLAAIALLAACSSSPSTDASSAPVESDVEIASAVADACTPEASETIADIQSRGTLEWATGISPPFTFKDDNGDYVGVEPDNAAELAAILGVDLNITEYDYSLLAPAIQSGKADIIGAQLFDTEERRQVIDFTDPYYLSGQLFYVREDSDYETIDDLDVASNTFAFGTGTAQGDLAAKYIPNAPQVDAALRGQLIPYDFLSGGRAQSTMGESGVMKLLLTNYTNPKLAAIGLNGRVTTERPEESDIIDPFDVAFGLSKGDTEFASCLNTWVADLVDTGREAERIEKWAAELENQ
ncbi:substrate-binding periplasmic protein [Amnibacterium flavum]|uniref:Solute-binding protein family 3/N-terminal domain-containing protein n=1 Tax=Amnibacterium flavum TaxID=2173173 RepID=A0A2V1HPJ0_9MICO|nr:ABC transporter substrate-binding protein [Amnibacterium flavum]PVZ94516.1 hypothetical protein DDQ50_12510 [Amnibacterium flavum]